MQKKVKIIRHVDCEGPGYLLDVFNDENIPYEIIKVDEGQSIPQSTDDMLALVSMGGGMSVNDDLDWISPEIRLIQKAVEQNIPTLGHCLGAQLMAKAMGSTIYANPVKEIGWFNVTTNNNKASDYWLADLSFPLNVFHWHGETFDLPNGAQLLLSSEHCENQCFVMGNMLAFQCHIEMTESLVHEWAHRFADQINEDQATEQSPELMLENLKEKITLLNQSADVIYRRWIKSFCL